MTDAPLGNREWAALAEIAKWQEPYRYNKVTMMDFEQRGYVQRTHTAGKTIYWKITDAGMAKLGKREA